MISEGEIFCLFLFLCVFRFFWEESGCKLSLQRRGVRFKANVRRQTIWEMRIFFVYFFIKKHSALFRQCTFFLTFYFRNSYYAMCHIFYFLLENAGDAEPTLNVRVHTCYHWCVRKWAFIWWSYLEEVWRKAFCKKVFSIIVHEFFFCVRSIF